MIYCVPVGYNAGWESPVFGHFGSAPYFALFEVRDTPVLRVIANAHRDHEHGTCDPAAAIEGLSIETVVVRSIGRRALERLRAAGIKVRVSQEETVGEVAWAAARGTLQEMDPDLACHGHARQE